MATKDINKAIVKEQIHNFRNIVKDAVKAKDVYRKRQADLKLQRANYSDEYTKELQGNARAELAASYTTLHGKTKAELEKLHNALRELDSQLNLADPALQTALNTIHNLGSNLNTDTIQRINAQFVHDQPALKLLQSAYKAASVSYDGGIDRQIYNAESLIQEISNFAEVVFTKENGSINNLAGKIAKLATFEGHEFEKIPDPVGADEVLYQSAGLPAPE